MRLNTCSVATALLVSRRSGRQLRVELFEVVVVALCGSMGRSHRGHADHETRRGGKRAHRCQRPDRSISQRSYELVKGANGLGRNIRTSGTTGPAGNWGV